MNEVKAPTLGNLFGLLDSNPRKDPSKIVNDALEVFTKAEEGLNKAVEEVQAQIEADTAEIKRLESLKAAAQGQADRLNRVRDCLKGLLA